MRDIRLFRICSSLVCRRLRARPPGHPPNARRHASANRPPARPPSHPAIRYVRPTARTVVRPPARTRQSTFGDGRLGRTFGRLLAAYRRTCSSSGNRDGGNKDVARARSIINKMLFILYTSQDGGYCDIIV